MMSDIELVDDDSHGIRLSLTSEHIQIPSSPEESEEEDRE